MITGYFTDVIINFILGVLVGTILGIFCIALGTSLKGIKRWFKRNKKTIYQILEFIVTTTITVGITLYLANVLVSPICANTSNTANCAVTVSPNAIINPSQPVYVYIPGLAISFVALIILILCRIFYGKVQPKKRRKA